MFARAILGLVGLMLCLFVLGTALLFRLLVETIVLLTILMSPPHRRYADEWN